MNSTKENLQVLFEDNHIIIVNKRAGDITQGDKTGDKPLSDVVKEYVKDKYNKPGLVFIGLPYPFACSVIAFHNYCLWPCRWYLFGMLVDIVSAPHFILLLPLLLIFPFPYICAFSCDRIYYRR